MAKRKISAELSEYFSQIGRKGGKRGGPLGGKRSLETMTPEERTARAKKAAAASAKVRSKAAKKGK
jgi:truncated hemoglobin YjbI